MALPDDVKQWRKTKREEMLALREAMPPTRRRELNDTITRFVTRGFPQLETMTIGFYWPYRGEFDPRLAILHFRRAGARAALPEVIQKGAPLRFRLWYPSAPMTKGVYDIPVPETEVVRPQALLIPPIAFDAAGYRLGYGGGFFDRTLAAMSPQPLKIGVAFELSRIPTIGPQPHDIPMDYIVTEAGIHRVNAGRLEPVELGGDPGVQSE